MSLYTMHKTSNNVVDYIRSREYGMRNYRSVDTNYGTRHILTHHLFNERSIPLENIDKVYCSQWLSSNQIIFGTQCHKLLVYNVKSHKLDQIPLIKGCLHEDAIQQLGINSLKTNPSRTLLATGAYNSNEIAVYSLRLPTLDPIVLAEHAHSDVISDIEWIDDEVFLSSSMDKIMAIWHFQDAYSENSRSNKIQFLYPKYQRFFKKLRVRAMTFNKSLNQMVTLSVKGIVHGRDVERFKRVQSSFSCGETYCMQMKNDSSLYAVGCEKYIQLLDSRNLHIVTQIPARSNICGIRSLSVQDDLITIGTGVGVIMFYDIRAGKYIESSINSRRKVVLKTSPGYVAPNEYFGVNYTPAVYTHCYDQSGTQLFSAGGPRVSDVHGIYAGLWQ